MKAAVAAADVAAVEGADAAHEMAIRAHASDEAAEAGNQSFEARGVDQVWQELA